MLEGKALAGVAQLVGVSSQKVLGSIPSQGTFLIQVGASMEGNLSMFRSRSRSRSPPLPLSEINGGEINWGGCRVKRGSVGKKGQL